MNANPEMTPSAPLPCLNFFEQMDVISKARLCLSLKVPADDATLGERNALYDEL
jgi:hypothetical protein